MKNTELLVKAIHLGLRKGFNQNLQFRNKWTSFEDRMTEYLLTVFVALEVRELIGNASEIDIQLEYRLFEFYNNAFPKIKWSNEEDIFAGANLRRFSADSDKKRIDIAVMYNEKGLYKNYRSLFGIEIKSINQHISNIEYDVLRLSQSMIHNDSIDSNSIDRCFSAFIKLYATGKKATTEENLNTARLKTKKEIDQLLDNKFRCIKDFNPLDYVIHCEEIYSNSLENYYNSVKHIPDFDLSWDPESETGEVMGFVIEIKRTNT